MVEKNNMLKTFICWTAYPSNSAPQPVKQALFVIFRKRFVANKIFSKLPNLTICETTILYITTGY